MIDILPNINLTSIASFASQLGIGAFLLKVIQYRQQKKQETAKTVGMEIENDGKEIDNDHKKIDNCSDQLDNMNKVIVTQGKYIDTVVKRQDRLEDELKEIRVRKRKCDDSLEDCLEKLKNK